MLYHLINKSVSNILSLLLSVPRRLCPQISNLSIAEEIGYQRDENFDTCFVWTDFISVAFGKFSIVFIKTFH